MINSISLHRSGSRRFRRTLRLENLEARLTPASPNPVFSVGAGAGDLPLVNVYFDSGPARSFFAYNVAFRGGVRVATADINGDGVRDTITAPGPGGGPDIRVFDGVTGVLFREFLAYDPAFLGGVFVAAGDVNFDGRADIITGAGAGGGPHVKLFNGATQASVLTQFFAYDPSFRGGVSVSAGDTNGDQVAEVITGAGVGGAPHVRVFDVRRGVDTANFFAFDPALRFGVNVAAEPTGSLGNISIITSQGAGGTPEVRIFNNHFVQITSFLAFDASFRGGVNVGSAPAGPFSPNSIITGLGPGGGSLVQVRVLGFPPPALQSSFLAFDPSFIGGVFVG